MTDTPNDNNTVVLGGAAMESTTTQNEPQNALPAGTRMGEFEILSLVGEGGFGIVYLAQDHSLQRKVALKEYMPASLASRGSNATVTVRSERLQETFEIGRRSFVNEARLLAQFDHPSLVKVYRFWEANGTAYMAMPYYDGTTLRDTLQKSQQPPDEAWLKKILDPITEALATIHGHNCFHRDIAPDNIMLLRDGRPVLLDFGAARRVIGDMTQALTVILKPGYAPIEQYAEMPNMRQGAWTDIYALAAVIYYAVSRRLPPPSVSRIMQDSYVSLAEIARGRYSDAFLRGVDQCLIARPEQRPQTIAEMRELLEIVPQKTTSTTQILISLPEVDANTAAPAIPPAQVQQPREAAGRAQQIPAARAHSPVPQARPGKPAKAGLLLGGIAAGILCIGAAGAGWYFFSQQRHSSVSQAQGASPNPAAAVQPATTTVAAPQPAAQTPANTTPTTATQAAAANTGSITGQNISGARLEPISDTQEKTGAVPATARKKPARTTEVAPERRSNSSDNSERDYMHKVNKDLDDMLR